MNKLGYTQPILQYPTDLIFTVMTDDVSNLLTILKSQQIHQADYVIDFSIIGESHCITISYQEQLILQEVLACTDIPRILQADSHKFVKLEPYQCKRPNYQSHIWFTEQKQIHHWQPQQTLRMDFPEMFGEIPFTEIAWQINESSIQWRTTHVYPLETHITYVYSESLFDLKERSQNECINRTDS